LLILSESSRYRRVAATPFWGNRLRHMEQVNCMTLDKKHIAAYFPIVVFLAPSLLLTAVFLFFPAILEVYFSFTDWDGISSSVGFVGFRNFRLMLQDDVFALALRNTVVFCLSTVVLQHLLSLCFAVLIHRKVYFGNLHKALLFVPSILSTVVVSLAFSFILNPISGHWHELFSSFGFDSLSKINWLGDPSYGMAALVFVSVWQYTGYCMVIYMAALADIPKEMLEAGSIDGTNGWQQFWFIEFPSIAPAFTINTVLSVIGNLKAFELVFALTGGGPGNSTEVIATYIYRVGFTSGRMGYGTAVSLVLFIMISAISFIQIKLLRSREQ